MERRGVVPDAGMAESPAVRDCKRIHTLGRNELGSELGSCSLGVLWRKTGSRVLSAWSIALSRGSVDNGPTHARSHDLEIHVDYKTAFGDDTFGHDLQYYYTIHSLSVIVQHNAWYLLDARPVVKHVTRRIMSPYHISKRRWRRSPFWYTRNALTERQTC
jgi:hypothetical protein